MKRLFRDECQRTIDSPGKGRFPILLSLKKDLKVPKGAVGRNPEKWIRDQIINRLKGIDVFDIISCFEHYLTERGVVILLDGLDEVASADYPFIESAILALSAFLANKGKNNIILITMRIQFHYQIRESYSSEFPMVFSVKPFTPSDVYESLSRWPFSSDRAENILRIFSDLNAHSNLRDLCSNPLILAMYVANDLLAKEGGTPDTRTIFYKAVTDELLLKRRQRQTGERSAATATLNERYKLLGSIALDHMLDGAQPINIMSWDNSVTKICQLQKVNREEGATILRQLETDTGIITEERYEETITFMHLTLCEYFAAHEAVATDRWEELIERHTDFLTDPSSASRLAEVIPFTCGQLPSRRQANAALARLRSIGDLRAAALSLLETKAYDSSFWPDVLAKLEEELRRVSPDERNTDWLRSLRLFIMLVSDVNACAPVLGRSVEPYTISNFIRELAGDSGTEIQLLLSSYADHDAPAALALSDILGIDMVTRASELVLDHCDQPAFLGLMRQRAEADKTRVDEWASLLSEAALRSRAVAQALSQQTTIPSWSTQVDQCRRDKLWFTFGLRRNFLTECLTLAHNSTIFGASREDFKLRMIEKIPSPSESFTKVLSVGWERSVILIIVALLFFIQYPIHKALKLTNFLSLGDLPYTFTAGAICGLIAGLLLIFHSWYHIRLVGYYLITHLDDSNYLVSQALGRRVWFRVLETAGELFSCRCFRNNSRNRMILDVVWLMAVSPEESRVSARMRQYYFGRRPST